MPRLVRIVIQLPQALKLKWDELKLKGYTASGFIRAVLEREFTEAEDAKPDGQDRPAIRRR